MSYRKATAYSLTAALLANASVSAANWEFAPRIEGSYRYSDNYRLELPGGEIDVSGAEADASLAIRTVDPRTSFEIIPRVRATYFPDEREQDSTDYFLRAALDDVTPRRSAGFTADVSREDVVRSELPGVDFEGDLGDPLEVDSGLTIQRNRRDLIRLTPHFSYEMTERSRVELEARYVDAQYDRQFENRQQDFSEIGAAAGFGFQATERSMVTLRALASQYETGFDTRAYGGEIEWRTDLSPTAQVYASAGAQRTDPDDRSTDTSVVAGVGGRWTSQRNAFFVDLTRAVRPTSGGTIVERHQLRLRIDHDVSPRTVLVFGTRAARDEEVGGGVYPTREYLAAEAGFEWRWQRFLSLKATYNYRWQEYEDEPSDASANGFLIGLVYEPKRRD